MSDPLVLLAKVRREVDDLAARLSMLAPPPAPDEMVHKPGLTGPMWNVIDGDNTYHYPWRVRAIDDEPGRFIYVHHPRTFDPSDFEPMTIPEARKLALALLAACVYMSATELEKRRTLRNVPRQPQDADPTVKA